ncbi:MAG TPA: 2Fe-2S iron-sulfur cluster-binding protein, partial [Bryobacteraceae bacterium]
MPKVTFLNIDGKGASKTVEFEHGKLPYDDHGKPESLLDVAMNFNIHLEHACGGSCACTTCHVWIKEGLNNVSEPEEDELDR